jgi:3-oxoacyl-[acyl-carrier-protein] synthase II
VVATAEGALRDAQQDPIGTGFVVGSAFGDVARSVRFLQKVLGQGPKFASPGEFPQLIASSGSGNASIYLGLTGPCLSVSEFGTSGESAISVAISLLELGLTSAVLAGAAEAEDAIVDAVLGTSRGARGEGGGFLLLEALPRAVLRGHVPLATLIEQRAVRGDPGPEFAALSAPPEDACVVSAFLPPSVEAALLSSTWRAAKLYRLPALMGVHEALGATALAVAVAALAAGNRDQALVVSADVDTVYLTRLKRYEASP